MDKKSIFIGSDMLADSCTGLGKTAYYFGRELMKFDRFAYSFMLPDHFPEKAWYKNEPITLDWKKKYHSSYLKHFDLCHVLHPYPRYSVKSASRMILTIHDLNFLYLRKLSKQNKYRQKVQALVNHSDAVCFISESTRRDCEQVLQFSSNQLLKVIYNGVNDLCDSAKCPSWCPSGPFLFTIGQFTINKNFKVLIPMMKQLPSYQLVVAGINTSKVGEDLKALVKEYGLEKQIIIPGAISEEEKSYLYHACEAFVFPSIAEGFGLPIIEAMKCGKPVFCAPISCSKEIGKDYAFYWENFDPDYMADSVLEFLCNKGGDQAWQKDMLNYANSFTWKKNVSEYMDVYDKVLG